MDMNLDVNINNFIKLIKEAIKECDKNEALMNETQAALQDRDHTLELDTTLKYHDYAKLGKDIRDICRNRRKYKDIYLYLKPIREVFGDNTIITKLTKALNEMEDQKKYISNRIYIEKTSIPENMEGESKESVMILNNILKRYSKVYKCESLDSQYNDSAEHISFTAHMTDLVSLSDTKYRCKTIENKLISFFAKSSNDTVEMTLSDYMLTTKDKHNKFSVVYKMYLSTGTYVIHGDIILGNPKNMKGTKK
jgi:hypothetical protein